MQAVVFDQVGPPLDVLYLHDVPMPTIAGDETLVRMVSTSINPGDFLFVQNLYPEPKKPHFPRQIAGNHGAGVVVDAGRNAALKPGMLVAFSYYNAWAEYAAVPADWLIPLPSAYPVEKAAQLMNIITAWDLLDDSGVKPGQWLALTAGHSTVATMVAQMASARGVNVIALVRRVRPDLDLKALGASVVVELEELSRGAGQQVMEITQGRGVDGVIDCLGGPVLGDLIRSATLGAQVIIYGGMSSERIAIHNFDVLLKVVTIRPHVYRYFFTPPPAHDTGFLEKVAAVAGQLDFRITIGGRHALDDFRTAVHETIHHPERGKRFLKFSSQSD